MLPPFKLAIAISFSLSLAACVTTQNLPSKTIDPVCKALIGPLRYNSYDPSSKRFAGVDLAPDLARRNSVWRKLHCKA